MQQVQLWVTNNIVLSAFALFILLVFLIWVWKKVYEIFDAKRENEKLFKDDSVTPENMAELKEGLARRDSAYKIIERKKC